MNEISPAAQRPLSGQVVLLTGANTGIGRITARELAKLGARLFLACRSEARSAEVLREVRALGAQAEWLPLDLGDLGSVRACAERFLATGLPLHLLINNAGLAGQKGLTASGFEIAFGTNHIGHFLLTTLLLDRIKASGPARIVTLASRAHYRASAVDWDALRQPTATATGIREYCVSKLANVLFSAELARRLEGTEVHTYSLHPGVIGSEIWRGVPWIFRWLVLLRTVPVEQGYQTTLHCATSLEAGTQTGLYYSEAQPKTPSRLARDTALAAELWRRSEAWVA
jgi:NAD(P)-dependent dehydrogenase (short-subunit alcohol dehydrogenase family)